MADGDEPVFAATLPDVRQFTNLLRSVAFQQRVKVIASEAGLMVQVEEARVLQCRSYIPSNTFSSYVFNPQALQDEADRPDEDDELTPPPPPDVALEINLSHLIECLNIFGGAGGGGGGVGADAGEGKRRGSRGGTADDDHEDDDGGGAGGWGGGGRKGKGGAEGGARTGKVTAGRISWHGPGEPLEVLLMDESAVPSSPTTTCSLSTSEADFESDIEFPEDEQPALHIICAASWLKDALSSLDPSATKVTLSSILPPPSSTFLTPQRTANGSRAPPPPASTHAGAGDTGIDFRLESQGTWGDVRIDFENSKPLCLSFVRTESVRHSYRKSLLQRSLRALAASQKVSLILYPSGVLFMQCMLAAPAQPDGGNHTEAERARRREERERRRRGEVTDGIVELRMMSLEEMSDDES